MVLGAQWMSFGISPFVRHAMLDAASGEEVMPRAEVIPSGLKECIAADEQALTRRDSFLRIVMKSFPGLPPQMARVHQLS